MRRVSSPNDPDFAELCVDGPTMEPQMYRFPAQNLVKSMCLQVLVAAGTREGVALTIVDMMEVQRPHESPWSDDV